jgi:hypothetical protein
MKVMGWLGVVLLGIGAAALVAALVWAIVVAFRRASGDTVGLPASGPTVAGEAVQRGTPGPS